jgi:hypothetical protein
MRWQRRWVFRASMRSSAETEPSQPTLPFAWGVFGPHRRNFGERLRSQTCRGQRNRQQDQTSEGGFIAANSPALARV